MSEGTKIINRHGTKRVELMTESIGAVSFQPIREEVETLRAAEAWKHFMGIGIARR